MIDWFWVSLQNAFTDIIDLQRNQRGAQTKRRAELIAMNDRLLNAFLAGSIDEATFNAKLATLRDELAVLEASLGKMFTVEATDVRAALAIFELSQQILEISRGSKNLARFNDARKTTDSRSRIFEPSARRRNS